MAQTTHGRRTTKPKVLFVTPEAHPLVKTGGLGDVSGALPAALRDIGVDTRLLMPGYPAVLEGVDKPRVLAKLDALPGFRTVRLLGASLPGNQTPLIIVDYPALYARDGGPYLGPDGKDWPDNVWRFGLLSRVAALLGSTQSPLRWRPDIVHGHDWQAGLAPAYMQFDAARSALSIVTIHNLAFQGIFPPEYVTALGLPPKSFAMHGLEYYGKMSFLKAGLFYADHLTTVSPTYAEEIQSHPLGFGLEGLLASRKASLTGILNGIDADHWNPATDQAIAASYSADDLARKKLNKAALQKHFGLAPSDRPLLGVVSRMTAQKGLDLVADAAPALIRSGAQLVVLGGGDSMLEKSLTSLADVHPRDVAVQLGFDEPLSHLIEAGADIFLMPSRFEPCGLNQMYSMRYGTPPVVRATGGLADTVVDTTPQTLKKGTATGFVFSDDTAAQFEQAVLRALKLYATPQWQQIQRNGMARDFSWTRSAEAYAALYHRLLTTGPKA